MPKRRDNVQLDVYDKMKGGRARFRYNEAISDEMTLTLMYERILTELSVNLYEWTGFPASVNTRFLELAVNLNGLAVVFKDTGTTKRPGTDMIMALRASPSGQVDMMGEPVAFTLSGPGINQHFQGVQLSRRICVPVWPNALRMTNNDIITTYARKLANVDRTIEINLKSARRTKVLVYDENTRLSAENINRQIDSGEGTIRVKFDLGSMITGVDLGVDPKSIETLSVVRARLWSEAMGLLGINNSNQDKKERLVESEVSANDDQIQNMRFVALNARQEACRQMRRMFPDDLPNVWVEYRSDVAERKQRMFETMLGLSEDSTDSADESEPINA